MKFKTKEELLKPIDEFYDDQVGGFNSGISKAFQSFAERVELFKKYRYSPDMFANDFPDNEWWNKNKNQFKRYNRTDVPARNFYEGHYHLKNLVNGFNNWLFDYCFGDVIE